jgi:hypothetical protein
LYGTPPTAFRPKRCCVNNNALSHSYIKLLIVKDWRVRVMKFTKKGFVFALLIVSALVIGSVIIKFSSPDSLLGTCIELGISNGEPLVLDLIAIQVTFGLSLKLGVAHIVMLILAIIVYPLISKNVE